MEREGGCLNQATGLIPQGVTWRKLIYSFAIRTVWIVRNLSPPPFPGPFPFPFDFFLFDLTLWKVLIWGKSFHVNPRKGQQEVCLLLSSWRLHCQGLCHLGDAPALASGAPPEGTNPKSVALHERSLRRQEIHHRELPVCRLGAALAELETQFLP